MRFLFIDRITKMEKGKTVEGIKTFSLAEECHRSHFSKSALVPGVLLIETMAQVFPKLGKKVILDDKLKGVLPLLSLDGKEVKP